jgi:hypothetical protein
VQGRVDDWLERHMGYAVCMRTRVSFPSSSCFLSSVVVLLVRIECWNPGWHCALDL